MQKIEEHGGTATHEISPNVTRVPKMVYQDQFVVKQWFEVSLERKENTRRKRMANFWGWSHHKVTRSRARVC